MKPKHHLGTFTTDDAYWWKGIDIKNYEGYWGGETAAAMYTNYLKPEIATVYIPKSKQAKLIGDIQLRKVEKNDQFGERNAIVELYTPFWPPEDDGIKHLEQHQKIGGNAKHNENMNTIMKPGLVHPVLAYADLIATADTRNIEVARKLYDDRIAQFNRED